MRKAISYCLFGDAGYDRYLPAVVRAHHHIFPSLDGWEMWLIVDQKNESPLVRAYHAHGVLHGAVEQEAHTLGITQAMLLRLAPIFYSDPPDVVFCRDLDALPLPRDRRCCEDFIASEETTIHTIHDNAHHVGIMGGLSGFKTAAVRKHFDLLGDIVKAAGAVDWTKRGTDQDVLNSVVRPKLALFEHNFEGRQMDRGAVVSVPTPKASFDTMATADDLAPHLGAAGFDIDRAMGFYGRMISRMAMQDIANERILRAEADANSPQLSFDDAKRN